jgi:UDPglucose 6-dehydrogenase
MRLTVLGTGYLGAVHAACMADLGHEVLGVDVDPRKVEMLGAGRSPFFEPGLDEVVSRAVESGRLRFSASLAEAADFGDVHFVCVGTPQKPGSGAADLSRIDAVVDGLAPHLHRATLVVGKSTVPVGTAQRMAARIAELAPAGAAAELAWNPEFLREGYAVQDTMRPDRIVVGVTSPRAEAVLKEVYATALAAADTPWVATDLPTAELVKVSANAFLATKISFINAIAEVCDASGADVVTLAKAIGYDDRIGHRFLNAGLGFGGGCLPKDIRAFMARAGELGVSEVQYFLRQVDEINMGRRQRTAELAREMLGGSLLGSNVAVLGCAFKPNSDDVRDSPALNVAAALQLRGAQVRVHDPRATDNARAVFPTLDYTTDIVKACEQADLVLHLTEWAEYRELNAARLAEVVRAPRLLDARNVLAIAAWQAAGWTVQCLGRPAGAATI